MRKSKEMSGNSTMKISDIKIYTLDAFRTTSDRRETRFATSMGSTASARIVENLGIEVLEIAA